MKLSYESEELIREIEQELLEKINNVSRETNNYKGESYDNINQNG